MKNIQQTFSEPKVTSLNWFVLFGQQSKTQRDSFYNYSKQSKSSKSPHLRGWECWKALPHKSRKRLTDGQKLLSVNYLPFKSFRLCYFILSNVGMICVCLGMPPSYCIFISICACVWSSVTLWLCCICMYVYPAMDECSSRQAACVLSAASQETCSRQAEC